MEATVYILRCADGAYYTGLTKQPIEARLWEHNEGVYDGFTKKRRPVQLVFSETYDRFLDTIARERQIKGWSRAKKEALIALRYHLLPRLARNRRARGFEDGLASDLPVEQEPNSGSHSTAGTF
jgi:putative endonuclease